MLSTPVNITIVLVTAPLLASSTTAALIIPGLSNLMVLAIIAAYFIGFTLRSGATPGKRLFLIRVVPTTQREITFGQVVLRETIGRLASGIVLGIGYLWAAFDEKGQAWHDKLARTMVVKTGEVSPARIVLGCVAILITPLVVLVVSFILTFFSIATFLGLPTTPKQMLKTTQELQNLQKNLNTPASQQMWDQQRMLDLQNLRRRLEMYYLKNGTFPPTLRDLGAEENIPKDPLTGKSYFYQKIGDQNFILRATLSNGAAYEVRYR